MTRPSRRPSLTPASSRNKKFGPSAAARAFCGEVLAAGVSRAVNIEMAVAAAEGKLSRAGLLVLNPPFGFNSDMTEMLGVIAPRLPGGEAALEWLAGKP